MEKSASNNDPRIHRTMLTDKLEQFACSGSRQTHAAMRSGSPQLCGFICPMNGKAIVEEDRIWHRRVVVDSRVPDALHTDWPEMANRCCVTTTCRRNRPNIPHPSIYRDGHALGWNVDLGNDIGGCSSSTSGKNQNCSKYMPTHQKFPCTTKLKR